MPEVTYSTIYSFIVDRKVFLRKVSDLEEIADNHAEMYDNYEMKTSQNCSKDDTHVPIEYTRTFSKAYRFFKDGHVQDIRYHPMPHHQNYIGVRSNVLPSMKKDRVYNTAIILDEITARVANAHCTCTAGLSGCCNHVTATLYCLEEYIHAGLHKDEQIGCTDRLQTWNKPRKRSVEARSTDEVMMNKMEYGIEKRPKIHRVNSWDCHPVSRRIVDPNKGRNLRRHLALLEQHKIETMDKAVLSATNEAEKKKANQTRSLISRYGTSCFLQLLDDEASPAENRLEMLKMERLERAAAKKKFLEVISTMQQLFHHDHSYGCLTTTVESCGSKKDVPCTQQQHLINKLYQNHVCLSSQAYAKLEASTRAQSHSERWHHERKLRITASIMKEVCHRKATTTCEAFVRKKLAPKSIDTPAVCYGKHHEAIAIKAYVDYQNKEGIAVQVNSCGLSVDPTMPWLAASPDAFVVDPTQEHQMMGCLEVKCPYVCERRKFSAACKDVPGFCLVLKNNAMSWSKPHAYFYQVQTQMHATHLVWCDFVVWSPIQDIFVERLYYDPIFMKAAVLKAKEFYFKKFLPSVCAMHDNISRKL